MLALAAIMLLQLMPLPFSWWTAMPGRELARDALTLTGQAGAAHGWSLTPDRTLNSLFSLAVPAAMIMTMAALNPRERRLLLPWLLGAIAANVLLGLLQLLVGGAGRFRPFAITNMDSAVGFFANRNHSAVLLAAALPLAACLTTWPLRRPASRTALRLVAAGGVVLALLAILAAGSRAGLAMAVVGLAWAAILLWPDMRRGFARQTPAVRWALLVVPVVGVGMLVALAMLGSRDEAIRRLIDPRFYDDVRMQSLPTSIAMMRDLLPFGSGFGSFEPMYRAAEPRALLHLRYLNHAHNDYVELVIDAGIAGAAVLLVAAAWFAVRTVSVFGRRASLDGIDRCLARAASGILLIAALASVTDYPVRTPIWMLVAAIAAMWLAGPGSAARPKNDGLQLR